MHITLDQAEDIAFAADADLRTDYSGRFMYGAQCVGFVVREARDYALLLAAIGRALDEDEAEKMFDRIATDSMGLRTILYFPGVTVTE